MATLNKFLQSIWNGLVDLTGSYAIFVAVGLALLLITLKVFILIRIRFFQNNWQALKSIKRNGWTTFSSTSAVAGVLILVGLFASVLLNVEKVTRDIEGNVPVLVRLLEDSSDAKETITDKDGKLVSNPDYHQVYNQIKSLKGVTKISYSSKEEQLEKYKDTLGEGWEESPLLDVYEVKLASSKNHQSISDKIQNLPGVDSVDYGGVDVDKLSKITSYLRIGGLVGTAILVLMAIFMISNTIRLTISARQNEIQIMRLVGAKNSYIRGPFFFEGAWIGLIGSITPALLMYFTYTWSYTALNPNFLKDNLSLYNPNFFVPAMILGMCLIGMVIGALGSIISMRRFLKA